jgi:hypothetical protein
MLGQNQNRWLEYLGLPLIYTVLTLIMTYPLCVNFFEYIAGGEGDAWQFVNYFWWFKKALVELHVNPFYDTYMFYPTGVSLGTTTLTPVNVFLSLPLQVLVDLPLVYNLLFLLTFVLSGCTMYMLAHYLFHDKRAALLASIVFTFSPYRFMRGLGHLNLLTTQFVPLFLYFLLKFLNTKRLRDSFLAGLTLTLVALSSVYYLLQTVIVAVIIVLAYLFTKKFTIRDIAKPFFVGFTSFFFTSFPFYYPSLNDWLSGTAAVGLPLWYVSEHSADLLAFLSPPPLHPLFASSIYTRFTANVVEATVFVGFTCMALSVYAVVKQRTAKVLLWALIGLAFSMLSLGPELKIAGVTVSTLPYRFVVYPLLSFYIPSRFAFMYLTCVSLLAGYGTLYFLRLFKQNTRVVVTTLLCGLVLFEVLMIPYPLAGTEVPSFYQGLREDQTFYAVLEVPISPSPVPIQRHLYYQTVHEKALVGGWVSRPPPYAIETLQGNPLVQKLIDLHEGRETHPINVSASIYRLTNQGVRYIIVHTELLSDSEQAEIENMLSHIPLKRFDDVEVLIVYDLWK